MTFCLLIDRLCYCQDWFDASHNSIVSWGSKLFYANNFFYKNCIFTKKNFLLDHIILEYFSNYMDLSYQFGILWMCTFCWFEWFLTKLIAIFVADTNMSKLFFRTDLIWPTQYLQKIQIYTINIFFVICLLVFSLYV